ncbi:MAG: permease-like cell division protein FtsX [Acidimicrobiales bacterium]
MRTKSIQFVAIAVLVLLLPACGSRGGVQVASAPTEGQADENANVSDDLGSAEDEAPIDALAICMAQIAAINAVVWLELDVSDAEGDAWQELFAAVEEADSNPDTSACNAETAAASCSALRTAIVVWLDVDVDDSDVDALSAELSRSPYVRSSRYAGADETLEQFQRAFAGEPAILELVSTAPLPASFTVELPKNALFDLDFELTVEALIAEWEVVKGVDRAGPVLGEAAEECLQDIGQGLDEGS